MPFQRRILSTTATFAILAVAHPGARQPALKEVLDRAAAYVERFHQQLSQIVSEETYTQTVIDTSRFANTPLAQQPPRRLRSDLIFLRSPESNRFIELRDVFEVDGSPVRDRQARLLALLSDPRGGPQIGEILRESARYNIGSVTRNINTPLMQLQFLDKDNQSRFEFKHVEKPRPVFTDAREQAANAAGVFRVTTEMWTIEYRERGRNTIIRRPDGDNLPVRGRFWIDPSTGAVLISEMIADGGGVTTTVTVSYQSEPLMGFLVPVEMRELYVRSGERIAGHAVYGRFRLVKQ
ncbi:MAG TPA: hypothetical protein VJ691_04510 [Vicinamibacterales bacterium]|nr:hypothetical protein [Vicinamibacterales bacterium]